MAFQPENPPKKPMGNPFPKRGQIKAKIFGDIFKSITRIVSKAINRAKGGGGCCCSGRVSTSTSPRPSAYVSDTGP